MFGALTRVYAKVPPEFQRAMRDTLIQEASWGLRVRKQAQADLQRSIDVTLRYEAEARENVLLRRMDFASDIDPSF